MKDFPLFVGKNCEAFKNFYDNEKQFDGMVDGRIPSLLSIKNGLHKGTVIAAADKASCGADWGFIEIAVRRSEDNGKTFSDMKTIFSPPVRRYPFGKDEYTSSFAIDPLMMEANDGKVVMLVDFYPECKGLHAPRLLENGSGYINTDMGLALKLYSGRSKMDGMFTGKGKVFTLRHDGFVYTPSGKKTKFYVPKKHNPEYAYSTIGDMYYCYGDKPQYIEDYPPLLPDNISGNDIYVGNIFVSKGKDRFHENKVKFVQKNKVFDKDGKLLCIETSPAPLRAPLVSYIYKMESIDGGKSFSQPVDITLYYKKESDGVFLGVGPGVGITLSYEKFNGRILAPCYILNKALILISDDNGKTWRRNKGEFCENVDECQLIEMPDGKVYCFGRPKGGGKIPLSVSCDGGETFRKLPAVEPTTPQCQRTVICLPKSFVLPGNLLNDGRYILLATPTGHSGKDKTRTEGKLYFGRIEENDEIHWLKVYDITDKEKYASFEKYSDFYAYSCLTVLEDNTIGLLYEAYPSGYMTFSKITL